MSAQEMRNPNDYHVHPVVMIFNSLYLLQILLYVQSVCQQQMPLGPN